MAAGDNEEASATSKTAMPEKEDNLTYCLAHLAAFDIAPLHPKGDLLKQTRDNVQLLVNKVFGLAREDSDDGPTAVVPPEDGFRLPRTRPIPKVKPETRWEKFMKERKMTKRKRSRLVFDEISGDWKPRWGYKSGKESEDKAHGIMEVKTGQDSHINLFEKRGAEQKLYAAKQKMREVRNRVEAAGGRLRAAAPDLDHGMRSSGALKRGPEGLKETLRRAQTSSGSVGKFDRVAPGEATNLQQKKRKLKMPKSLGEEKANYLKAAGKVLSGEGGVDKAKAAASKTGNYLEKSHKGKAAKRRSKQGGKSRKGGGSGKKGR